MGKEIEMRKYYIKLSIFIFLWAVSIFANSVVRYNVYISHPVLGEHERPLIVTEAYKWHYGTIDSVIIKFYPMKVKYRNFVNGMETSGGDKGSWMEYYDAFILPDSTGYILVRMRVVYEGFAFLSIEKYREASAVWKIENPSGNQIFWSKDNNYLVTGLTAYWVDYPKLWFYDLKSGKKIKKMQFNSWKDFKNYVKNYLIEVHAW